MFFRSSFKVARDRRRTDKSRSSATGGGGWTGIKNARGRFGTVLAETRELMELIAVTRIRNRRRARPR